MKDKCKYGFELCSNNPERIKDDSFCFSCFPSQYKVIVQTSVSKKLDNQTSGADNK